MKVAAYLTQADLDAAKRLADEKEAEGLTEAQADWITRVFAPAWHAQARAADAA